MRSFSLILLLLAGFFSQTIAQLEIERIDPPHWWSQQDEIQLLVYGENIAEADLQVDYPKVDLKRVIHVENPNYVFVDLELKEGVSAGEIEMVFSRGKKSLSRKYLLKEKSTARNRIMGLDQSDLMYLIMPDRFANGNPNNDIVEGLNEKSVDRSEHGMRHGGDLEGVREHLDYLEELGVTAIWLNPAVTNDQHRFSYHGYAVTDHYEIDPRFGGNEAYKALIDDMHSRGMKMVMDLVHNHVGTQHWWYQDLPTKNWINQWDEFTKTQYRATTLLDPYASSYDKQMMTSGWFDTMMPDLNQRDPLLATYIIQNNVWFIEEYGIDALRMDTWAYADPEFGTKWSEEILRRYPQIGIFGETWVHGNVVQAFFHGKSGIKNDYNSGLPGLTDFQLYYAINEAINAEPSWTGGILRLYYTLAKDFVYKNPNDNVVFLDNHDLSRFYDVAGKNRDKFLMGIDWLYTVRGIPMIYYGTELGFNGNTSDGDGDVRQDFPGGWASDSLDKFTKSGRTAEEQDLFEYISKLGNWRSKTSVLHNGQLMQFVPQHNVYVYFRYDEEASVMVLMNGGDEHQIISLKPYAERLEGYKTATHPVTGRQYDLSQDLPVAARSSLILELK
jgi:glycosidase